jgi:ABC-type amino acid transport substrate-binding protein
MESLKGSINEPKDLAGKRVAVVQGSTSAQYVGSLRARTMNYTNFKDAAGAVLAGKADAVVYDSPVVLYSSRTTPAPASRVRRSARKITASSSRWTVPCAAR